MKYLLIISIYLANALTATGQTVGIERKEFDPHDSTYSLVTEGLELVQTSMEGLLDSALLEKWKSGVMRDEDMAKIMQTPGVYERMISSSIIVKLSRFVSAKKLEKGSDVLTCYIVFTPDKQVTVKSTATLEVIFEDGNKKVYRNEAPDKICNKGERASIYFTLLLSDPLSSKPLRSARLLAGEIQLQGQTNARNRRTIPKMVEVLNAEPLKL